jgi:hypothetical protein
LKTVIFDIETSPNLGYVWGKWEQNVIENVKDWRVLSFSYKVLGENKTYAYGLCDFPGYKKDKDDDTKLVKKLHEVLSDADVVVAHNGDEFDIKKANARFLAAGLTPPTPYKSIDTKKVAKKYFKFDSNKLDELGRYLGIGRKLQTGGFDLWKGCMYGDMKAWTLMKKYNKQDVDLLEKVYLRLRPWITNFPTFENRGVCRNCGSTRLQSRGHRYTISNKIQRLQCSGCGAWSDGKKERHGQEMEGPRSDKTK